MIAWQLHEDYLTTLKNFPKMALLHVYLEGMKSSFILAILEVILRQTSGNCSVYIFDCCYSYPDFLFLWKSINKIGPHDQMLLCNFG